MNHPPKTVFKKQFKIWLLLFFIGLFFQPGKVMAQGCECVGCQGPIPISSSNTYTLNISGASIDNLGDPNQGVCGVFLDVSFEHIWSLTITLTAPSGQSITLMGPYDNFPSTTGFSNWDISFLPCGNPVSPDPMASGGFFNDQWTNLQQWAFFTNYTGSYYPYVGCLEDFNFGTVNGDWTITVTNGSNVYDSGSFNGFSIQFCDDTGMGCTACDANAGDLSVVNDIDLCIGENFSGSIDPFYTFGSEPNNQYDYTYIVSQNSIIEGYEMTPDFSTYNAGTYELCGLSYLSSDVSSIPSPDGSMSVADLETIMTTTAPFCGDISDDCFEVTIYPIPDTIFISDDFCQGEGYFFNGITYNSAGIYYPILSASVGCDTTVELTLTELDVFSQNIMATICQGDTFFVENIFHTTTGFFNDTLSTIFGCDSIINLDLTVLNPTINIALPDTVLCSNPEIELDASGSTIGGGISYLWTTNDGNITGNATDSITTVDAGGKYYFTISQENDGVVCSVVDSIMVIEDLVAPIVDIAPDSMINCSIPTLVLDGGGSSIGSEFSYEWTTVDGEISQDTFSLFPTINSGGTYVLSVTNNQNGCVTQDSILILQNTNFPSASAGTDLEINCNNPTVQLDGSSSSQGTPYVYLWTTNDGNILLGEDGLNPVVDSAGTYQLSVIDTFSFCETIDFVEVTIDTILPVADAGSDFLLDCNIPEVQIDGSNSSQGGQFSYQWNAIVGGPIVSGATSLMPTVNVAGNYQLVVINDLTGCSSTAQVVVSQDFVNPTIIINNPVDTITCINETITIDASSSSIGAVFEYEWTVVGMGNILADTFTLTPQVDEGGVYQLEITNTQNGCTVLESVEVVANNTLPIAEAGGNMTIDCNIPVVNLDGGGSVGSEFEYLWVASNGGNILLGETTFNPLVNGNGDYELIITNTTSGCTQSDIVSVVVDTIPPVASAGIDTLINCFNSSITLEGSGSSLGNFTYLWTTTDGVIDFGENTLQPTISTTGNYELLVTNNSNGCSDFDSVFVDEDFVSPIAIAGEDTIITCTNPSIILDGAGSSMGANFVYLWTASNGGTISANPTSLQPEITSAGNYQLQVTNLENGCTSIDEVIVTADTNLPLADAGNSDTLNCVDHVITLDGTASSSGLNIIYEWATTDGNIILGENTLTPQVDSAGGYILTVTDTISGCSAQSSVEIAIDTLAPIANAGSTMELNCTIQSVVLDGTNSSIGNNYFYAWTTIDGNIFANPNTLQPTVNQPGWYFLEITNLDNGCFAMDSVLVIQNITPPISIAGVDTLITCENPILILDGGNSSSGLNYSYQWIASNGGMIDNNGTTLQPQISTPGNYELIITDITNGCTASDFLIVDIDTNPPNANAGTTDVITCDEPVLTLDGSLSSLGSIFEYEWTTINGNILNGENTLSPQVDSAGVFILEVLNTQNGCSNNSFVLITIDTISPIVDAGTDTVITCESSVISLDGTNSSLGDFTYSWSTSGTGSINNGNTLTPEIDDSGIYQLEIINNQNGCFAIDEVEVMYDTIAPIADAGMNEILDCDSTILTLGGNSSVGVDFEYLWTFSMGGNVLTDPFQSTIVVDAEAVYSLLVTNTVNSCTAIDEVTISQDTDLPLAVTNSTDTILCDSTQVILSGVGSSIGSEFEYEWITIDGNILGGTNTLFLTVDSVGEYVLTVTNTNNGCQSMSSVNVLLEDCGPIAIAGADTQVDCNNPITILDGTGSSMGAEFIYNWTTADGIIISDTTTLMPTVGGSGTYVLTVENTIYGTTSTDTVIVENFAIFPTINLMANALLTCEDTTVMVNSFNSSSGTNFNYTWITNSGNIISGINDDTIVVDESGYYALEVTDMTNGCVSIDSIEVIQDIDLPVADAGNNVELNCYNFTMELDGSGSSTGNEIVYSWITTNGNIVNGDSTINPTIDLEGLYYLEVKDTINGCLQIDSVMVNGNFAAPIANAGMTDVLTCQDSILTLDGTGSSQNSNLVYGWTTVDGNILSGDTSLTPQIDAVGTYQLVVLDSINGCTDTSLVFINSNFTLPVVNAGTDNQIDCGIASILLDGSGSSVGSEFNYLWTSTDGNILEDSTTLSPEITTSGNYILTVENTTNGCISADEVVVTAPDCTPIISIVLPDTLTCNVTQVNVDGSSSSNWGTIEYEWTTNNGNIIGSNDLSSITVDLPGVYYLLLTDTLTNETTLDSVVVEINDLEPIANAGMNDTLNCMVTSLILDGSLSSVGNQFMYEWTTTNGNIINGTNLLQPTINEGGIYNLLVTNMGNGCTASSFVEIVVDTILPIVDVGIPTNLTCEDSVLFLNGLGSSAGNNFEYAWTTLDGNIISGANTLSPQINAGGIYELTIQNSQNFCEATDQILISEDTIAPNIVIATPDVLNCEIEEVEIDANASSSGVDFMIQWQTLNGNIESGANSLSPMVNDGGEYELSIFNNTNGCSSLAVVTVQQDTIAPISEAGQAQELNCINTNLLLDGNGSSIGNEFNYQWQTLNGNIISGANALDPNIDLPGTYELIVTNSNNMCTSSDEVEITQNITDPTVLIETPDTLNCAISSIVLSANNSSSGIPFTYMWSTSNGTIDLGENSLNPQVSGGGEYILEITNNDNGCTALTPVMVEQDTILPLSEAGEIMTLTCSDSILTLSGNGSSIGSEYEYTWTTTMGNIISGGNSLDPQIDQLGIYQLEVTNSLNMCTAIDEVEVMEDITPPEIEINAIGGLVINCNVSSIVLDGTSSTPFNNVSFSWSTSNGNILSGNTDPNPEVDLEGDYQLVLTNETNGCTATESIQITSDLELPMVTIVEPDTLTCDNPLITISGAGSSVGNEFEYLWTYTVGNIVSGENELECVVDQFGGYILTVFNTENGCMASEAVTVYQNTEEPFADAGGNYEFDCVETEKVLVGQGSQGPNFSYEWTTIDGNIIAGATTLQPTVDAFGTYILTVTNQINGCTASSQAIVTEDLDVPQNVELDIIAPLCFGDHNGSIEVLTVDGGEAPYLYAIDGGTFSEYPLFSNLAGGTYSIIIQDASGCEFNSIVNLIEPVEVEVDLGEDIFLELGESTVLQAQTNIPTFDLDSVSWINLNNPSCENCLEQEITPLFTTGYSVYLVNENGCETADDIIVYVNNKRKVFIPNAFSPNDDGNNDIFMIYAGKGVEEVETFQIFNRWGGLVFEENNFQPNDPTKGWDGYFKGEKMNPSVFVFFAKIKYINGETEVIKGDLLLN